MKKLFSCFVWNTNDFLQELQPRQFFTAGAAALHRLSLRFCTGHFGYGKHPGQLLPFALPAKWGMQCTRPAGGKMLPQQSAGQIHEGWLACLPMET